MELKCNINPYFYGRYEKTPIAQGRTFRGAVSANKVGKCADIFMKRPVADNNASGLCGFLNPIKKYAKNYVKNVKHTYEHKLVFAMVEKELFGHNSIDALTHDADKMIMYLLGFPKSFVSKWHRKHSVHHTESGMRPNLRSMLCDNIASSPEFKPEKKLSLREHYKTSKELQGVRGFGDILEKYNYGESLDFNKIKAQKNAKYNGFAGIVLAAAKTVMLLLTPFNHCSQ